MSARCTHGGGGGAAAVRPGSAAAAWVVPKAIQLTSTSR